MTDEEFVERLGKLYLEVLENEKNEDYEINEPQMKKLIEACNFFIDVAKECDGRVESIDIEPKFVHGCVTATFLVFSIWGEDISRFSKIVSYLSAMTIDETTDGVCISVTVPDVYKRIEK